MLFVFSFLISHKISVQIFWTSPIRGVEQERHSKAREREIVRVSEKMNTVLSPSPFTALSKTNVSFCPLFSSNFAVPSSSKLSRIELPRKRGSQNTALRCSIWPGGPGSGKFLFFFFLALALLVMLLMCFSMM